MFVATRRVTRFASCTIVGGTRIRRRPSRASSGLDWKDKDVASNVRSIRKWFAGPTFEHFVPAICIPFPLWFDLPEPSRSVTGEVVDFYEGVQTRYVFREGKFGVIFDRGRIATACAEAFRTSSVHSRVDGCELIRDVRQWVDEVLERIRREEAK